MYDWKIDRPGKGREYDSGKVFAVWAAPGKYEVELEATLINWEAKKFEKRERIYDLVIRGPPVVDPVDPVDPVNPPPVEPENPVTSGTVYGVVIRVAGELNSEDAATLTSIRDEVDESLLDLQYYEFPPDAKNPDGSKNLVVKGYYDKIPVNSRYPYGFITQKDASGKSVILWKGEIKSSEEFLSEMEKATKNE